MLTLYSELYKTPILLVYGDTANQSVTVHLELLRCYSKPISKLFAEADQIRKQYDAAKSLKDELKRIVPAGITADSFTQEGADQVYYRF
jgi:hypothetical protein